MRFFNLQLTEQDASTLWQILRQQQQANPTDQAINSVYQRFQQEMNYQGITESGTAGGGGSGSHKSR